MTFSQRAETFSELVQGEGGIIAQKMAIGLCVHCSLRANVTVIEQ